MYQREPSDLTAMSYHSLFPNRASRRWEYSHLARSLQCFANQNLLGSHTILTGGCSILIRKSLGRGEDLPPFWPTGWTSIKHHVASQTLCDRRFEDERTMTQRLWDKYCSSTSFPLLLSKGRGEERCHLRCRNTTGDGGGAGNSKEGHQQSTKVWWG